MGNTDFRQILLQALRLRVFSVDVNNSLTA